jgi:tetratricopeptide (TPR) repeat protein
MEPERNGYTSEIDGILKKYHADKQREVAGACPPIDDLLDYIDARLVEEKVSVLEEHLPFCSKCQNIILSFELPTAQPSERPPSWQEFAQRLPENRRPSRKILPAKRFRLAAAVGLLAASLLMAVLLDLYPTQLSRLAYVDSQRASVSAGRSLVVESGSLEDYYRHGLDLLQESQTWKLKRVNEAKVSEAIQYLEKAKRLAQDANNRGYLAGCCFYLGKAYLKKGEVARARKQFEEFGKFRGSGAFLSEQREAAEILNALSTSRRE